MGDDLEPNTLADVAGDAQAVATLPSHNTGAMTSDELFASAQPLTGDKKHANEDAFTHRNPLVAVGVEDNVLRFPTSDTPADDNAFEKLPPWHVLIP